MANKILMPKERILITKNQHQQQKLCGLTALTPGYSISIASLLRTGRVISETPELLFSSLIPQCHNAMIEVCG